jgi:hypothetical protein
MNLLSKIKKEFPEEEFITPEGLDKAVIGIDKNEMRLIYSKADSVVETMLTSCCGEDEALEYLKVNLFSAYIGRGSPIWCDDMY